MEDEDGSQISISNYTSPIKLFVKLGAVQRDQQLCVSEDRAILSSFSPEQDDTNIKRLPIIGLMDAL